MLVRCHSHEESHERFAVRLLQIADEILSAAVVVIGRDTVIDVPWILAAYCLPAAGVVAIELLRQMQPDEAPYARAPKRSNMVQHLSVLYAAMEWAAKPGEGNYSLFQQVSVEPGRAALVETNLA